MADMAGALKGDLQVGFDLTISDLVPDDMLLFFSGGRAFGKQSAFEAEVKFQEENPGMGGNFGSRYAMRAMLAPRTKTLKRPSWLHPIKRVLWVHHHGPHRPTVEVAEVDMRTMGIIKGLT